jgi:WhiB family transcriptional regulator, redox-sensing transcriptional regulator
MTTLIPTADQLLSAAVKRELAEVPGTSAGRPRLVWLLPDGQVTTLPVATRQQLNILITGGFAQLGEIEVPVPWRGGTVQGRLVVVTDAGRAYVRNWQSFGPCGAEDPDLFFPASYEGPALVQVAKAKAVCHGCPVLVRARCLREHMADQDGIFGGTIPDERRELRRRELGHRAPVTTPAVPAVARAAESEWDVQTDTERSARNAAERAHRMRRWAEMTPEQQAEYRARMAEKNRRYRAQARAAAQSRDAVQQTEGVA